MTAAPRSTKRRNSTRKTSGIRPVGKSHRRRIWLMKCLLLIGLATIVFRLFSLHINPKWNYNETDVSHIAEAAIPVPRGNIYDGSGRLLATDHQVPSLSADPSRIADLRGMARTLAARLDLDEGALYRRLSARTDAENLRKFVWVKRELPPTDLAALGDPAKLREDGLRIEYERLRHYPQRELAAHVIGFVNRDRQGAEGVELSFDDYLQSTPGRRVARTDRDRNLLTSLTVDYDPPQRGNHVFLTIDADIQSRLERELDRAVEKAQAEWGMGILMDPNSGGILALAIRPAFDLNRYNEVPPEQFTNLAVSNIFEPGSAFKVVTVAAAIEEGMIGPHDPINCEKGVYYPHGRRRVTDTKAMGVVPFSESFAYSSNIAVAKIARVMGPDLFDAWIQRFGFGQSTHSDLRMESYGIYHPRRQWSGASLTSLSFGQEIGVTLLQLARSFSVIANGGYLVRPHVVDRVENAYGETVYAFEPEAPRRILHESTASIMKELCHLVVTDGTGRFANIPEYRVGGKTGTAQIARAEGGGYYSDRYNAIFAGFAPLNEPRIAGAIVVHAPRADRYYGGYVAGPVFRNVVREALIHMHVPPDPVETNVIVASTDMEDDPDTVMARTSDLFADSEMDHLLASLDGLELVPVDLDTSAETPRLPNFTGLTKSQVSRRVANLGIHWAGRGSGWAVYQDPPPGTPLHEVSLCRIVFSNDRSPGNRDAE